MDDQTAAGYAPEWNADPQLGELPPKAPDPSFPFPFPQEVQPVVPAPPQKQRRVGTFTLGLSLISLGVLIPCGLFFGASVWELLRLAPVLLIVLGIEVLIYAFRFKSERLRYDGLSIFMVLTLTFAALFGSLVSAPLTNAVQYEEQKNDLGRELQAAAEEALIQEGCIGYVSANVGFEGDGWYVLAKGRLEPEDWWGNVHMDLEYLPVEDSDQSQVEAVFYRLAKAISARPEVQRVSLTYATEDESAYYSLYLNDSELRLLSPELVSRRIQVERDDPEPLEEILDEPDPEAEVALTE